MGRFINADNYPSTGQGLTGNNMFAYCGNNPITRVDNKGECWHIIAGAVVRLASQYISDVVSNLTSRTSFENIATAFLPSSSLVDYLSSAASGAIAASGIGALGSAVANATISGLAYSINCKIDSKPIDNGELLFEMASSAVTSGKGINGAKLGATYKHSTLMLKTAVSPKKIGMYTAKQAKIIGIVTSEIDSSFRGAIKSGFIDGVKKLLVM